VFRQILVKASSRQMRMARLEFQRKKAAIYRIADLYQNLKVKKVTASMHLQAQPLYDKM